MRQGARLREHEHAFAEDHQRRNRLDTERTGKILLGLGVDLPEDDVGVLLRHLLEDRGEHPAGAAPRGPKVDQHDVVAGDGRFERVLGEGDGGHDCS